MDSVADVEKAIREMFGDQLLQEEEEERQEQARAGPRQQVAYVEGERRPEALSSKKAKKGRFTGETVPGYMAYPSAHRFELLLIPEKKIKTSFFLSFRVQKNRPDFEEDNFENPYSRQKRQAGRFRRQAQTKKAEGKKPGARENKKTTTGIPKMAATGIKKMLLI